MVIATDVWMQNVSDSNQTKKMVATGVLICHDNSFPFKKRILCLEEPRKIGRSVARVRATNDNAIFDCKVLSRNHALLWYDSGKFYLKDTKSSNGTFVNNKRLSPSGEESLACEVCSGDVVQFGVDVVESTKKAIHGCIVATLKLYLPDGKEAKASPSNSVASVNVTIEDLYKLNQFIQEAGRRENALRSKLEYMQQLLEHTRASVDQSWKASILEDCLLFRLEMLESQVVAYSKNFGADKLRIELVNLLEDKAHYQLATKELLQKKIQEKQEIITKVQNLNCQLSESEKERQNLYDIIKDNQNELQELAIKYIKVQETLEDTTDKLNKTTNKLEEVVQQSEMDKQELIKKLEDQKCVERNLQISLRDSKLDTVHIHKQITALRNYIQTLQDIRMITGESISCKNYAKPIDAINIILNNWNSMYLEILDNEFLVNENKQKKYFNSSNHGSKCKKSPFNSNHCKYILPPVSDNTVSVTNILETKDSEAEFKDESISSDNENILNFESASNANYEHVKKNLNFSVLNSGGNKKENIASLKLVMRFSSDKSNNNLNKTIYQDNFESQVDYLNSENILNDSLSAQIIKIAQQINKMIEIKRNLLPMKTISNIDQVYLHNHYTPESLEPFGKTNSIFNKWSREFILHNILRSSNFFEKFKNIDDCKTIIQDLQDFKNWLLCESNEVIMDKLQQYHDQFENENQQVQELSEQLVILKEKYNATIQEKSNIIKKYTNLQDQYKNIINTSYMVPIYYVAPLIFTLIWVMLEKLL